MKREEALARGRDYLDEATENITFDEFTWALEEVWRGVAWVLNALAEKPQSSLDEMLGPKGDVPPAGTLRALLEKIVESPRTARVATELEARRAGLVQEISGDEVARLVFDAWELHDACGKKFQLVDERLRGRLMVSEESPGRVGSRVVEGRTALKIMAAAGALALQGCMNLDGEKPRAVKQAAATQAEKVQAKIRAVTPIQAMHWETSDPFLFCAYHKDDYPQGTESMGPVSSLAGRHLGRDFDESQSWRMYHGREIPGFPRHPHRGFETVTVLRSGFIDHADSLGATARFGPGDVQWLTAGQGIQHAEMFPLVRTDTPNPLELFQIWLNLPRKNKMVDPYFTMFWSEKIPRVVEQDKAGRISEITIAAGAYKDAKPLAPPPSSWATDPASDVAIWSIRMEPHAVLEFPAVKPGTLRSLYVHRGQGVVAGVEEGVPGSGRQVGNRSRIELADHEAFVVQAGGAETEILLLQGRPMDEPIARRGPFVMNTQEEIRQAYADYQRTGFGGWPWRNDGPAHERQNGRFAIHADGKKEVPG